MTHRGHFSASCVLNGADIFYQSYGGREKVLLVFLFLLYVHI